MNNKTKILAISHSFLKKINTQVYLVLKNKYNFYLNQYEIWDTLV